MRQVAGKQDTPLIGQTALTGGVENKANLNHTTQSDLIAHPSDKTITSYSYLSEGQFINCIINILNLTHIYCRKKCTRFEISYLFAVVYTNVYHSCKELHCVKTETSN